MSARPARSPHASQEALSAFAELYPAEVLANPMTALYLLEDPAWDGPRRAVRMLRILRWYAGARGAWIASGFTYHDIQSREGHGHSVFFADFTDPDTGTPSGAGRHEEGPLYHKITDTITRHMLRGHGYGCDPAGDCGDGYSIGVYAPGMEAP